jgi:hypothetical protein
LQTSFEFFFEIFVFRLWMKLARGARPHVDAAWRGKNTVVLPLKEAKRNSKTRKHQMHASKVQGGENGARFRKHASNDEAPQAIPLHPSSRRRRRDASDIFVRVRGARWSRGALLS